MDANNTRLIQHKQEMAQRQLMTLAVMVSSMFALTVTAFVAITVI